jgi:hypothetical protein
MRRGGVSMIVIFSFVLVVALLVTRPFGGGGGSDAQKVLSQLTATPWPTDSCLPVPLTPVAIENLPGGGKRYVWDMNNDGTPDGYSNGGLSLMPCIRYGNPTG